MRLPIAFLLSVLFCIPAFAPIDLPPVTPAASVMVCKDEYRMLAPAGAGPAKFRVLLSPELFAPAVPASRFPADRKIWEDQKELIYENILGESLLGRELERFDVTPAGDFELIFHDNPQIVKASELKDEPSHVAAQRASLRAWMEKSTGETKGYPATSKTDRAGRPEGKIVSAKTINSIPTGAYSFVKIRGERFMRIAPSNQASQHGLTGAHEDVDSAGEIFIEHTPNGVNVSFNLKSGLYTPDNIKALEPAVKALWNQGIYPDDVKFYLHVRPIDQMHGQARLLVLDLNPAEPKAP